jgi:cell division protein FtsB
MNDPVDPVDPFSPEDKEALRNFSLVGLSSGMETLRQANVKLTEKVRQLEYDFEELEDYINRVAQSND